MHHNVPKPKIHSTDLTPSECARLLGWKTALVQRYIKQGKIITDTLPGGSKRLFVSRAALERFARRMGIELKEMEGADGKKASQV
jgi:hypothetical protein